MTPGAASAEVQEPEKPGKRGQTADALTTSEKIAWQLKVQERSSSVIQCHWCINPRLKQELPNENGPGVPLVLAVEETAGEEDDHCTGALGCIENSFKLKHPSADLVCRVHPGDMVWRYNYITRTRKCPCCKGELEYEQWSAWYRPEG